MSRVKRAGGEVHVLFLTVGDTTDFSVSGRSTTSERLDEIEEFAAFVALDGFDIAYRGDAYHLRLDNLPRHELVTLLERTSPLSINALEPTIVAFPDVTSYNQDHKATAYATSTALRPGDRRVRHQPSLVLSYEEAADGWSTEQPSPRNVFIELDQVDLDQKIKALGWQPRHPSWREGFREALA
jgi:N-acetylglucosamine malate deacetylase 1